MLKIKIITIGHLPLHLNLSEIINFKSSIYKLDGDIEKFSLRCDSDCNDWTFSDILIKQQLPSHKADFLLAIVNVPIEKNYYSRRLGDNQIVLTFHEIKEYFKIENIPLENAILRAIYAYSLLYKMHGKIPSPRELSFFTHDETRGCLFDLNGIKSDVVESCHNPIICSECSEKLRTNRLSEQTIHCVKNEIEKIRKNLYFRISDKVKMHPIKALIISSLFAIAIGIISSFLYDAIKVLITANYTGQNRAINQNHTP